MRALFLMLFPCICHAASVVLFNDSPFILKAQVIAADGTDLGTVEIKPQVQYKWQQNDQNVQKLSETPYTVIWYCRSNEVYGTQSQVSTGAFVSATVSNGAHFCKPEKKKTPPPKPGATPVPANP